MTDETIKKHNLKRLGATRRKAVSLAQESLVKTGSLEAGQDLPLLVQPRLSGVRLAVWAEDDRDLMDGYLRKYGGILFRGFGLADAKDFEDAVRTISGDLLEYQERSSPRSEVGGKIYTSTDYPPDQPIFLHNENSYQQTWPMRIFFFCHTEPEEGGETPIADVRKIYQRMEPRIRHRFVEKQWSYVRNFGDGFGLAWHVVFQTDDKSQVEAHCRQNGIEFEWKEGNRLRTRAVRPAAVRHPETEEMLWFNHATFFHVSTLTDSIREALLQDFTEDDLPSNTYYGDGSPISPEVLERLRAIYHSATVSFRWRQGDLLMLDNMMIAHGRAPFTGDRKILVAMSHPCSWSQVHS